MHNSTCICNHLIFFLQPLLWLPGKTDRIDLTSYHLILACIAEVARIRVENAHPTLRYQVINSPTPDARVGTRPEDQLLVL